jgi:glycosyltransferase involved in cell wall biosynthesis
MPYALALLGRRFVSSKHITGYWSWELPRLPESWAKGFDAVHDIVVPSTFNAQAVRAMRPNAAVRVAPHPVALDCPSPPANSGDCLLARTFTIINCLSIGSGFERKNPLALIRAFKRAFGQTKMARLKLLVTNANQHEPARKAIMAEIGNSGNVEVTWTPFDRQAFYRWWECPDVYASLHRAEGFGLPLAEALCTGYPVIATGWSGNMDFMSPLNSYPVDFKLVAVADPQGKYPDGFTTWAEPDVEHAAGLLAQIAQNRKVAQAVAYDGKQRAREQHSGERFCAGLLP